MTHDPRDHFDFSYIDEGWHRVVNRLATGKLSDFALAIHAIADFYAHTVYAEFGPKDAAGKLVPYEFAQPRFTPPKYDFGAYQPLPGC